MFCVFSGDFIGPVSVKFNVFSVLEGERFQMTCSATHEDKRPELRWKFVSYTGEPKNLTGFRSAGKGKGGTRGVVKDLK